MRNRPSLILVPNSNNFYVTIAIISIIVVNEISCKICLKEEQENMWFRLSSVFFGRFVAKLKLAVLYAFFAAKSLALNVEKKLILRWGVMMCYRAVEALWVIVVVQSLHPAVPRLYWEATGDAFCCEELVPIWKKTQLIILN